MSVRNSMPIDQLHKAIVLWFAITLMGCGGGSSTDSEQSDKRPTPFTISGNAVKSEISGAEIRAFYFDATAQQQELVASNSPVITDSTGAFDFRVVEFDLAKIGDRPLIIYTQGGIMGDNGDAPVVKAVLLDAQRLADEEGVQLHISFASSVATGLVESALQDNPDVTRLELESLLQKVEQELAVDLTTDPSDVNSSLAKLNLSVDQNLGLFEDPSNNSLVTELVEYYVANLSSNSGKLDNTMRAPDGSDVAASFNTLATQGLASAIHAGVGGFNHVSIVTSKSEIENSGVDHAVLTVAVKDAAQKPVVDGTEVMLAVVEGDVVLSQETVQTVNGYAHINVTSITPGDVVIEAASEIYGDKQVTATTQLNVVDLEEDLPDQESPRVVTAGAISNTEILVVFSEAMRGGVDSAEDPQRYTISANPGEAGVGGSAVAVVRSAELLPPDFTTVRLTTFSQSEITYSVKITDVKDVAGNTMAIPIPGVTPGIDDPSSGVYVGIAPTPDDIRDTDGDGITDTDEQFGWSVTALAGDGTSRTVFVSSDPRFADTDLDGIPDSDERQAGLDPRSPDTDGDTLDDNLEWNNIYSNPKSIDSDGDGIEDGFEVGTFKTSPILADTDGDQISDMEEVIAGNRNPLVSDLPSPRISVGNISLRLDTRFTFTNTQGEIVQESSSVETTLVEAEDDTFAESSERATISTLQASQQIEAGGGFDGTPSFSAKVTVGSSQGSQVGSTFSASQESVQRSEETYHQSLNTSAEVSAEASVLREVLDGALKVDVEIDNAGDIPFTIRNIELIAMTQDPADRSRVVPVASLVPENPDLESINIGVLGDTSRGPFSFRSIDVFPSQIEELMKNPRGLFVQLANFDIVDEEGRNFSFSSQEVLDRTAGITFDLGDGRVEIYRVSTASAHNPATGEPLGITLGYALEQILGLTGSATIVDGGNGVMETEIGGDDIAIVNLGDSIEPGRMIVQPGPNGVIDTVGLGGDDQLSPPVYATQESSQPQSIRDGGDGVVSTEADAQSDDVAILVVDQAAAGQLIIDPGEDGVIQSLPEGDDYIQPALPPRQVLTRFRDVETNANQARYWGVFSSRELAATDFQDIVLRAGDELNFTFVQDRDGDGVFAREEFLHGSSDLLFDTDEDLLSDKEEVQDGWRVQIKKTPNERQVYPNPLFADSDRDLLDDRQERNCLVDPRQRDTDLDGLTDYEEIKGVLITEGIEGKMVSRDRDGEIIHTIVPYLGAANAMINNVSQALFPHAALNIDEQTGEDLCALNGVAGFATDPTDPDTDGDGVSDGRELALGIHPNYTADGPSFLDDDGDGIPNLFEKDIGYETTINGIPRVITSNPNEVDTDRDGLPDLLERFLGSDARATDSDGDGIGDFDEYAVNGNACVTVIPGQLCEPLRNRAEMNYNEFIARCEDANSCGYDEDLISDQSLQLGTNLSEADSDFDGAFDRTETLEDFFLISDDVVTTLSAPASDPLAFDSDGDTLSDGFELQVNTEGFVVYNPSAIDTDGDGANDNVDNLDVSGTQPNRRDRRVTIRWNEVIVQPQCDGNGDASEFSAGRFWTRLPNGQEIDLINFNLLTDGTDFNVPAGTNLIDAVIAFEGQGIYGSSEVTFVALEGGKATLGATGLKENDSSSADDDIDSFVFDFELDCGIHGCALDPGETPPIVLRTVGGDDPCFEINVEAFNVN